MKTMRMINPINATIQQTPTMISVTLLVKNYPFLPNDHNPRMLYSQMHLFTFVKPSGVTGSFPSANGCKRDILLNLMISSFF